MGNAQSSRRHHHRRHRHHRNKNKQQYDCQVVMRFIDTVDDIVGRLSSISDIPAEDDIFQHNDKLWQDDWSMIPLVGDIGCLDSDYDGDVEDDDYDDDISDLLVK